MEVQELLMAMSNNSQSISTLQQKSKQHSIDADETNVMPSSRNQDSDLKNNDTAEFGLKGKMKKESENMSELVISAAQKIQTMRSKREDSLPQNITESKKSAIKEQEDRTPEGQKASTWRNDANTDDKQTSNFNRTISKISNSKMISSQSQQNFLRAGKMKIKEQLQIKQELKELEKENQDLKTKIEEMTKESIKWKSTMSQRIVALEETLSSYKAKLELTKEEYARDLLRATKLSKEREKELINNIKTSLELEYKVQIDSLKSKYEETIRYLKTEQADYKEKYELSVTAEMELRNEYDRVIQNRAQQDLKNNSFGTFTVGFEDKNITADRFKHYLKISLGIENTDFLIHCVRTERVIGSVNQTTSSTIFGDEEGSNEIMKFYVSFYDHNNQQRLKDMIKLMKEQVKEGKSKLNFINPLYLGINYGRIAVNSEDYSQISLDKYILIFREGIYIKSTYLLCSIYEFRNDIRKDISIKILAFDNQSSTEYMIDLDYSDLLDIFDSNVKIIQPEKDLATYLVN